ncbi:MAG TPA: ATP-binding protein [Polyangiaceae bacterium]|nr:ATP-binding protein [Polyangiaceae bacterium]
MTVVLGWLDRAKSQAPHGEVEDAIDVALSHARLGHSIARRAIGAELKDGNVTRSALSVARDALLGVAQEASRRGVAVSCDDEATNDLLVRAAPVAQQILINLLLNAVHFSPPGTRVELVTTATTQEMCFKVCDAGPGIAPERVESLFRSPESTRPGGAGIGLRHAHALAEKHGGCLSLVKSGPTGSVFELAWPLGEAASAAFRTAPLQSLDGMRILLLEDDPAVQTLVDLGLSTRGASVATASTVKELDAIIRRGVFDVALLDLSPLGKNPATTLELIEQCQRGLPVVIISGSIAPDIDAPNVTSWVRKPFEIGELVHAVASLGRR